MYYRLAIQTSNESSLKWTSTSLASLEALFQVLRRYIAIPQDRLRVFMASTREEMNMMLAQENNGQVVSSVTAELFLCERRIGCLRTRQEGSIGRTQESRKTRTGTLTAPPQSAESRTEDVSLNEKHLSTLVNEKNLSVLERRRLELEMGAGGDHDSLYTFTLPISVPQLLAWTKLLARVQHGELQP